MQYVGKIVYKVPAEERIKSIETLKVREKQPKTQNSISGKCSIGDLVQNQFFKLFIKWCGYGIIKFHLMKIPFW